MGTKGAHAAPRASEPWRVALEGLKGFPIAYALRRSLRKGYKAQDFRADVLAGVVVGIVALPLSMALAIAVGAPPQQGLYTAIFAGSSVALLGGCKFQVTGPTAAFVVILAPIVTKHGLSGLLIAGLMAGVLLVAMGACRLGNLIRFIPYPVTTGFTTGIATVIATLQIKDVTSSGCRCRPCPSTTSRGSGRSGKREAPQAFKRSPRPSRRSPSLLACPGSRSASQRRSSRSRSCLPLRR
jgi:SulP family sulfate permease